MANTNSVAVPLDVISKYSAIVKESLGGSSVYIRAKETVQELVADGAIDDAKKAEIISSVIGGAVGSITNAAMSTALEWSKYEKELALKKLELDQQLLILAQDEKLKEAQVDQIDIQNRLALVESSRIYGPGTFDVNNGTLTSVDGTGSKLSNDMALVSQQTANAVIEKDLLNSKVKESAVAIHKVVADTYTNFGAFTFTYDGTGNGLSSVTRELVPNVSLSDTQQDIAIEQGKGYTYNAWANALTGSASILGTAIASGDFNFNPGTSGDILVRTVINCANNLATSTGTSDDAIPVDKVSVPAAITVV